MSLEKKLEKDFVKWVDSLQDDSARDRFKMPVTGKAVKGPATQYKGIPDRIAVLPNGGGIVCVEFKSADSYYKLTPTQQVWQDRLKASCPDRYFVVENYDDYNNLINACLAFMNKNIV